MVDLVGMVQGVSALSITMHLKSQNSYWGGNIMATLGEANVGGRMVPAWLLNMTAEELDNLRTAVCRRNLLDNWYFVGDGSPQSRGGFPINQRGFTTGGGSNTQTFDRWRILSYTNGTVSLDPDGVSINGILDFGSLIESSRVPKIPGLVITISALNSDGQLVTKTTSLLNNGTDQMVIEPFNWGVNGNLVYTRNWSNSDMDLFYFNSSGHIKPKIVAAKLELGPTQTLAYQDGGGNWKLFETPDYAEELARCQRYLLVLPGFNTSFSTIGAGSFYLETSAEITISTPTTMRIMPTCLVTGSWLLRGGGQAINVEEGTSNFFVLQMSSNSVSLVINGLSGCPVNQATQLLRNNSDTATITFSAEL